MPSILSRKKVGECRLNEERSGSRELKSGGGVSAKRGWSAEEG